MNKYILITIISIIISIILIQILFYHKKHNVYQINQIMGINNISSNMNHKFPTILRLFSANPQKILNNIYDDLGLDRKNEAQIIVKNKSLKKLDFYKKFAKYTHMCRPLHIIQYSHAVLNSELNEQIYRSPLSDSFFIMNIGIVPITIKLFSPENVKKFKQHTKDKNSIIYLEKNPKTTFIDLIIKPLDIVYIPNYWIYQIHTDSCDYCCISEYSLFTYFHSIFTKFLYKK